MRGYLLYQEHKKGRIGRAVSELNWLQHQYNRPSEFIANQPILQDIILRRLFEYKFSSK
jgi:hypothetical protein